MTIYRVIISDSYVCDIFNYYVYRADTGYIYGDYSTFKIGENVQAKDADGNYTEITGDRVSLTLVPTAPISDEGVWQKESQLMQDGVLKMYHGGVRFSRYLGMAPTGSLQVNLSQRCLLYSPHNARITCFATP